MKLEVMTTGHVPDITGLPLRGIRRRSDGLHIGALDTMSEVATHRLVTGIYPVISRALLDSASPQLRNMAGNSLADGISFRDRGAR